VVERRSRGKLSESALTLKAQGSLLTNEHSNQSPSDGNANNAGVDLPSAMFSEEESEMYLSTDEDDLFKLLNDDFIANDFSTAET
jgi:hypothetical protein